MTALLVSVKENLIQNSKNHIANTGINQLREELCTCAKEGRESEKILGTHRGTTKKNLHLQPLYKLARAFKIKRNE